MEYSTTNYRISIDNEKYTPKYVCWVVYCHNIGEECVIGSCVTLLRKFTDISMLKSFVVIYNFDLKIGLGFL